MALIDKWTRTKYRAAVRREILDPNSEHWTDTELNSYIANWQNRVQDELQFTWGTASSTTTVTTNTLTAIATDILRPAMVFWNNRLLSPLTIEELSIIKRDWRNVTDGGTPTAYYEENLNVVSLWPPPSTSTVGTLSIEYPLALTFAADTSTSDLPPWTKYSCTDYCAMRSYMRYGVNMDMNRALAYKSRFREKLLRYNKWKRNYLGDRYGSFKAGGAFEYRLTSPNIGSVNVPIPSPAATYFYDETPSGTVNGTNPTFTLTNTPSPSGSLKLFLDGVLLTQTTHYAISGTTITFVTAFIPRTGQTLFASYRYAVS